MQGDLYRRLCPGCVQAWCPMSGENMPPATADKTTAIFDALDVHERIVQSGMGMYFVCVGIVQIWRALAGPEAVQVGQLLQGLFFAGLLGPLAICWHAFRPRSDAR